MEERFKFRHVHAITGTFVLVVLGVLITALVFAGRSQRWFIGNVRLRIVLPEEGAAGIRQGSEVYFLGTLVGTVSDVRVDSAGRMEAQANIRRDFFVFVRADSSAVVKKKFGLAGDSFFEISRGLGAPLPEDNASILCKEQLQSALEAAVEEVRHEVLLVLKKASTGLETWTRLGADLGETRQHLNDLTVRMESMAAGIEAGKGTAGKLIADTALAEDAQMLLARANEAMSELRAVGTNLAVAVKNIQTGTARLPEITGVMADEAQDLPGLVQQTHTSMRELERLIEAMQRHWLLRRYVNKTNPPSSRLSPAGEQRDQRPKELRSPKNSVK